MGNYWRTIDTYICLDGFQFGLKNFDLVFVFKDYSKPVQHINSIPMNQLENIKDWLDSVDIAYSEGTANLNWTAIMKHINEDPAEFYAEGGWSFLQTTSDDEEAVEEDDDEEDEDSEYAPSGSEEEEEEESESDYEEESDESDESIETPSEDEGEDWSDMEEEARQGTWCWIILIVFTIIDVLWNTYGQVCLSLMGGIFWLLFFSRPSARFR